MKISVRHQPQFFPSWVVGMGSLKDTFGPIETCCFFNTKIKKWKPPFTSCTVQVYNVRIPAVVVKTVLGSHFGLGEFTAHLRTYFTGEGCSLRVRDFDPWPNRPAGSVWFAQQAVWDRSKPPS